jgi:asparagine synthase (glutamine-hydrolysing)
MYMDWEIFKAAQSAGVRTVLSGFDGDSTVSHGYEDLANLALRRRYFRLLRESMALRKNMPRKNHTLKRLFWRNGVAKSLPAWTWSAWRRLRGRVPADYTPSPIVFPIHFDSINPSFRVKHDLKDRVANLYAANFPEGISAIELHWRALTNGHFAEVLENLEKASAAFEVEPRFPFFDRRLVEFCIALPPGQRIYRGWTRSIFRHAMKGIVPSDVLWRTDKSNIGASVKINMLMYGSDQLTKLLETGPALLNDYVDPDRLMPAYLDYRESPMERDQEALLLLRNVYLLNWLENNRAIGIPTTDMAPTAHDIAV